MGLDLKSLATSKKYTQKYTAETVLGGGAVVGKNVTIQSISPIDGGNQITFAYTLDDGTAKTSTMSVMNGEKGDRGDRGEQGLRGEKGVDGTVTFSDLTPEQKAGLIGTVYSDDEPDVLQDGMTWIGIK